MVKLINQALEKFTTVKVKDYVELLKLQDGYEITVLTIKEEDWLAEKKVAECNLRHEGINIIGIQREDGTYIGTPDGKSKIVPGDQLMLYGRIDSLRKLEQRKKDTSGDEDHEKAVEEQKQEKKKQEREDKESDSQD
jgi:Trk K+ transport system NAD-binding subunit